MSDDNRILEAALRAVVAAHDAVTDAKNYPQDWRDFARSIAAARVLLAGEPNMPPRRLDAIRDGIGTDALMTAWAIIANVSGGDWSQQSDEWRAAAERWRDEDFHPTLAGVPDTPPKEPYSVRVDVPTTSVTLAGDAGGVLLGDSTEGETG